MRTPGPLELIIILVVVIIVFGVGRLPEIGGALGRGIREFREATGATEEEKETAKEEDDNPQESEE